MSMPSYMTSFLKGGNFAPATRVQVISIVAVAILGAATGVSMLIIAYLSGHLDTTIEKAVYICLTLAALTGIVALILQLRRHSIIVRAVELTMDSYSGEHGAEYIKKATKLRDALISSGDLDVAYRIQDAISGS